MLKQLLIQLLEAEITETVLEDGTEISNLHIRQGKFPNACDGFIVATINGREVKYPYHLECCDCGGCD